MSPSSGKLLLHRTGSSSRSCALQVWACGSLGVAPAAPFLDHVCHQARILLKEFSGQHISNTLWALATLGHTSKVGCHKRRMTFSVNFYSA
jgi:hypothetical protein